MTNVLGPAHTRKILLAFLFPLGKSDGRNCLRTEFGGDSYTYNGTFFESRTPGDPKGKFAQDTLSADNFARHQSLGGSFKYLARSAGEGSAAD